MRAQSEPCKDKLSSLLGSNGGKLGVHKDFKALIEQHCQGVDME